MTSRAHPDLPDAPPFLDIDPKSDVIRFDVPPNAHPVAEVLTARVVELDHSSLRVFHKRSPAREEIKALLVNTVVLLQRSECRGAAHLAGQAERVFAQHLSTQNRIRYLIGMTIGIGALTGIAGIVTTFTTKVIQPFPSSVLILLLVFAGMGSVTSVVTRLASIDLRQETSRTLLLVSGATRPIVASFFAIVVALILDTGIVTLHFGNVDAEKQSSTLLVVAFLCGFSERFAVDILARVGGDSGATSRSLDAATRDGESLDVDRGADA